MASTINNKIQKYYFRKKNVSLMNVVLVSWIALSDNNASWTGI